MPEVQEREVRLKQMVVGGVIENKDGVGGGFRNQEYGSQAALAQKLGRFGIDSNPYLTFTMRGLLGARR